MPDSASRREGRPSSPGGCHPPGPPWQTPPQKGLVLIAHGSADPRAAAAIGQLMPLVARRATERGLSVPDLRVAYLGHAAPSVPQVMRAFGPDAQVTVLPLLLTAAYHSKTDIPRLLARVSARMRVTYGEPLGPHPLLLRALERRLPAAAFDNPAEVGVVLAAAGSSDPEANATVARLAAQWQARNGWRAVRPAYASPAATGGKGSAAATGGQGIGSTACPDPATAVTGLLRAGARRVVVASYLLAPGLFADRIRAASLAAGAAATSPALLPWPPAAADAAGLEVADVVLDRYQEASTRERAAA
jgi:sirohydrochlorin ferrochelatase